MAHDMIEDLRHIYESGRREEGFCRAQEILAQHPDHADAAEISTDYLFNMGQFAACAAAARQIVASQPKALKIWLTLAQAHAFAAEYGKAEAALREAIGHLPDETILHNHLGIVYRMAGKTKEAIEIFRDCARRDPGGRWNEYNMLWGFLYEPGEHAVETYAALHEGS